MNNFEFLEDDILNKIEEIKEEMKENILDEEYNVDKANGFLYGLNFVLDLMKKYNKQVTMEEIVWDYISNYSEEYKEEINIDKLDDEDIGSIVCEILNRNDFQDIVYEEIEYMACSKK